MAIASEIKERMEVLGSDGEHVGTVDRVEEDDMIRLADSDSPDGKYHYIPVDFVARIEDKVVHLNLPAEEAVEEWEDEDEDEEVDVADEPVGLGEGGDEEDDEDEGSDERVDERRR